MPIFLLNNLNRRSRDTVEQQSWTKKSWPWQWYRWSSNFSLKLNFFFFCHDNALRPTQTVFSFYNPMICHDVFFSGWKIFKAVIEYNTEQKMKSVKKVITYLEMNLEAIFLEHLELYIGGNFFYQKNFSQFFQL